MILVTHDVDEAVYLGDRVVTMAPRPGRIERIVSVDLPRPRRRDAPAFARLRDTVLADFDDSGPPGGDGSGGIRADAGHPHPIGAWRLAW